MFISFIIKKLFRKEFEDLNKRIEMLEEKVQSLETSRFNIAKLKPLVETVDAKVFTMDELKSLVRGTNKPVYFVSITTVESKNLAEVTSDSHSYLRVESSDIFITHEFHPDHGGCSLKEHQIERVPGEMRPDGSYTTPRMNFFYTGRKRFCD